jgi:nucleoside-diphosphate-sugar epimerase
MTKRRILILGAAGFIGRRLVASLARDPGIQTLAAVRVSRIAFPAGVAVIELDATDCNALQDAMRGISGVVNCVAGTASGIRAGAQALSTALDRCAEPPRLVHLSSLAAYGTAQGTVDESAPLLGDLDEYSAAKAAAERTLGTRPSVVILRPGIVYGPESPLWSGYIGRLLITGRLGNLGSAGEGICNLVYIEDVRDAILKSLVLPGIGGRAFNLAASAAPTWNEYFRLYGLALKAPPLRRMSTLRLIAELKLMAPVLKLAERVAGPWAKRVPPAIRPWLLALCEHDIRMDVCQAETSLQMVWEPLERGLQSTAKWFRNAMVA